MDTSAIKRQLLCLFYAFVFGHDAVYGFKILQMCENTDIDIMSERGVKIEDVAMSHVRLNMMRNMMGNKFQIDFEFKTRSPSGVLFYSRPQHTKGQSIALVLEQGYLKYKVKCPTLHADIFIPTHNMSALNDGRWHSITYTVKFKKHGRKGVIAIDGFPATKRYEVSCANMASIIMGGTSPHDQGHVDDLEDMPHFHGCFRNVLKKSYTPLRTPPKYFAVSNCD